MQALSQLSYGPIGIGADDRLLCLLVVLATFTDNIGDVVVALLLLLDEGRLLGLLDLEIVLALRGNGLALLALGLGIGLFERNQLGVLGLRDLLNLLGLRRRGCGSGRGGGSRYGVGPARQRRGDD